MSQTALVLVLLLLWPSPTLGAWASDPGTQVAPTPTITVAPRVAHQLVEAALTVVAPDPLTVEAVDGAVVLVRRAAALDPDNLEVWRTLLRLADLSDREELRLEALQRILKIDPRDEAARLLLVLASIDREQTFEGRVAAFERTLAPQSRSGLGDVVASRVAEEYAVLLQRNDDERWTRWMTEAVSLDPCNRSAVALAAGYFPTSADPYGAAELFTALLLADPVEVTASAPTSLASLLLEHGAYRGAARFYKLALRIRGVAGQALSGGLLADRAVALWGMGDAEAALAMITSHQNDLDARLRVKVANDNPAMNSLELARLPPAPLAATLAAVRAAITTGSKAAAALRGAIAAAVAEIEAMRAEKPPDPVAIGERYLQLAFVILWLGGDPQEASGFVDAARAVLPGSRLDPVAQARFDGWIALRRGDVLRALELLDPVAAQDPAARLGLAMAQLERGRAGNAARNLWEIALEQPGSLMGVWARQRLSEILGQKVPPSEMGLRLEKLAASVPPGFDRYADEPTLALTMRLLPTRTTYGPYEPITVNLEITNQTQVRLAVDKGGPIRPYIVVVSTARISGRPRLGTVRPTIASIEGRLHLEPGERLVVPLDLRRSELEKVLDALPLPGAVVTVRALLNIAAGPAGNVQPSLLGSEVESQPIRVDGVRVTQAWLHQALTAIAEPDSPSDLEVMALLGHFVAGDQLEGANVGPEFQRFQADTAAALAASFAKLDPVSRAWLLGVMPRSPRFEALRVMARRDEDPLVRIAYLLYALDGPGDPALAASVRSNDPDVKAVADLMLSGLRRQASP